MEISPMGYFNETSHAAIPKSGLNHQAFELTHIQLMKYAFCGEKLLIRTFFSDLTVLDNDYVIGVANRG